MSTRQAVVREAYTWLKTPYHHHARVKGAGVDCAQLLCAVYETCGLIPHHETGFYPTDWHLHRNEELFVGQISQFGVLQPSDAVPLPGDAFVFRYGRTFSHGAVYVGDDSDGHWLFIHSYLGRGVILSGIHEEPLIGRTYRHWSIFK